MNISKTLFKTLFHGAMTALDNNDFDAMTAHCEAIIREAGATIPTLSVKGVKKALLALPHGEVNTRTRAGRDEYDARVLSFFEARRGDTVLSARAREQVGGSVAQFRASCTRLIDAGVLGFEGRTRGTRYFAPRV